jgi:ribulose-bisphosphate carboxylase large chain
VDFIKDDQGLADQPFCRFEERVSRCAEAIAKEAGQRGRPCLYLPHVSGPAAVVRRRAEQAKEAGAGGLLIAPGLTGFDALHDVASDDTIGLPIASHPAFLGTYASNPDTGLSPAVLYGLLPRLAGADVSIYPGFAGGYGMSHDDCLAVATNCRKEWDRRLPTAPTAAGRVGIESVREYTDLYGPDVLFILGSRIQQHGSSLARATEEFMRAVAVTGGTPV